MTEPESNKQQIEEVVLEAIRGINLGREPASRVTETVTAALYGREGVLDSLGLVALLMDVEEGLRDRGIEVTLSDERAMSQKQSPFRSVPTLVAYIQSLLEGTST